MSKATDKLRQLQAKMEEEQKLLEKDLGSSDAPVEVKIQSGQVTVVEDPEAEDLARRKAKLRKKQMDKVAETSSISVGKVVSIALVAVTVALLLLLLLFNKSDALDEYEKPLTVEELKEQRPDNPCPDPWWIDSHCLDDSRLKSKSWQDTCDEFFTKYGYTSEFLKGCKIDIKELPADAKKDDKKDEKKKDEKKKDEQKAEEKKDEKKKDEKKAEEKDGGRKLLLR